MPTARPTSSGRDTSGNLAIWAMNGAAIISTGALGNVPTT
jgi:hypothetical protein